MKKITSPLEAENKLMQEALEWYADPNHWYGVDLDDQDKFDAVSHTDLSAQVKLTRLYGGALARKVLSQIAIAKQARGHL